MSLKDVGIGENAPEVVNVIIEIPRNSGNKYELDKDSGLIMLDRVQPTNLKQPYDYGFIPQTLGDDNDPLDALIVIDEPLYPGVLVYARVLGVMHMVDSGENDEKIVCVAHDDVHYEHVKTLDDLGKHFKDKVTHYFEHYKDLQNKKVEVTGWAGPEEAYELIKKTQQAAK